MMNPLPGEIWLADYRIGGQDPSCRHCVPRRSRPATISRLVRASHDAAKRQSVEVPIPRLPFLDRESVANVRLGLCPRCVWSVRLVGFPRGRWNRSKARWPLRLIFNQAPEPRTATPLGRIVALPMDRAPGYRPCGQREQQAFSSQVDRPSMSYSAKPSAQGYTSRPRSADAAVNSSLCRHAPSSPRFFLPPRN